MIAVLFEVRPAPGKRDVYLTLAAELAPALAHIDGFISIERFQSLNDPDKLLSLSFWRDEAAVEAFRTQSRHRAAQHAGRSSAFLDYRLRVASVQRDYGLEDREQAPTDSRAVHG